MPNHVTHRIIFNSATKQEMDDFLLAIAGADKVNPECISFDRLIAQPEVIRNTESGSNSDLGLALLGRADLINNILHGPQAEEEFFGRYLSYGWVKAEGIETIEQCKAYLQQRYPQALEAGRRALAAHEATGFTDWYRWRLHHWGTKWDAYSSDLSRVDCEAVMVFDTAWSPPEPVLHLIAERFPHIRFSGAAFDEGWGFAVVFCAENGQLTIHDVPEGHMNKAYAVVYGDWPKGDELADSALPAPLDLLEELAA